MHFLTATIQAQYKRLFKNKYLDFSDADYAIEPCWSFGPEEVDLPIARQLLGLRRSAMCIVTWQREPRARMPGVHTGSRQRTDDLFFEQEKY